MSSRPMDELLKLVGALNTLTSELGLRVHLVAEYTRDEERKEDDRLRRWRDDFAWFQAFLTESPASRIQLVGNYAAVHNKEIVSVGPSEKITRLGAAEELKISQQEVLVVPVQVPGSEDYWEGLQAELDSSSR